MNNLAEKIQNSELEIMKALWENGGTLPLREIWRIVSARCDWEYPTVKTLLRRLQAKEVVSLESRGVYRALISEEEYNTCSARSFVDRVFSGSAKKLMAALVSNGQLNEEDIAELSELLNGEERP